MVWRALFAFSFSVPSGTLELVIVCLQRWRVGVWGHLTCVNLMALGSTTSTLRALPDLLVKIVIVVLQYFHILLMGRMTVF